MSAAADYHHRGLWGDATIAQTVAGHARSRGDQLAFAGGGGDRLTWSEYDEWSDRIAALLHGSAGEGLCLSRGDRVAVWLPDLPLTHVVYVAVEKAGCVIVGIGARAGDVELRHLLAKTNATVLVSLAEHRGRATADVVVELREHGISVRHLVLPRLSESSASATLDGVTLPWPSEEKAPGPDLRLGPDELWLLNSTSGTTGLPKCVMHTQNRWFYYHQLAVEAGELSESDVWLSALPTPFGFGIWTGHTTPTILGCPTILLERFVADDVLPLIEKHRVTVLACVSTQFIMLLNAAESRDVDLSSLRVMFTGGESVPFERAAQFEDRFDARVLQFFGSNETGALSCTTMSDSRDQRLRTAGRVIPEMKVRLFDEGRNDVTESGRGMPAGRGPATCLGYLDDAAANAQLFTEDGWMLMGDIVEVDAEGYLTVLGRTADIIIRGGKNISAAQVEDAVASHPAVILAAAVAVPDPIFGERVCVFVEPVDGLSLTLDDLVAHLGARGVSKELWPERLEVMATLPRASGGKVAKGELRRVALAFAGPQ